MACGGCNTSAPVSKDQVENILNKALDGLTYLDEAGAKALIQTLIDQGKIQGGLLQCDNNALPGGSKIPTCDMLVDTKITEILVNNGEKSVTLVFSDGATKDFSLKAMFDELAVTFETAPNGDITISQGAKSVTIPSVKVKVTETETKFTFANQDGSEVVIPKHFASIRVTNTFGDVELGFIHTEKESGVQP